MGGVAITLLTSGIGVQLGSTMINEGIGDAIFALSSLKTGYFSWDDYLTHKKISLATSVTLFLGSALISKMTWCKSATKPVEIVSNEVTEIGKQIGGPLSNKTGYQIMNAEGWVGAKMIMRKTATVTLINCKSAAIQAGVGFGAEYLIKEYINNVTTKIVDGIDEFIQQDFYKHEIHLTINEMLKSFNRVNLKTIIMENYQKISSEFEKFKNIFTQVSSTIDTIIRSDQYTTKWLTVSSSLIAKTAEAASVGYFVNHMFDKLNSSLKEVLATKKKNDENMELNENVIKAFNADIVKQLRAESTIHCRNVLNSAVIKPALTYVGNMLVKKTVNGIESIVEDLIAEYKESQLNQRAMKLHEALENLKNDLNSNIPEDLINEAMEIRSRTRDPKLFAQMMMISIPYDPIGIKCVQEALERKFGFKFQFNITKNGNEHNIGSIDSIDPNIKIINLDLVNGHFVNSSKIYTGNDCLYYAICEQFPELKDQLTPDELRSAAVDMIDKNPQIKYDIRTYDKEFYTDIGFYGGEQAKHKTNERFGSYYELKNKFKNRIDSDVEIDHIPPKSVYDLVIIEVKVFNFYDFNFNNRYYPFIN